MPHVVLWFKVKCLTPILCQLAQTVSEILADLWYEKKNRDAGWTNGVTTYNKESAA